MDQAEIPKTVSVTPIGHFKFQFVPFSLKNAAQKFQQFMDILFRSCSFVFIYFEDILIFSKNWQEHLQHL